MKTKILIYVVLPAVILVISHIAEAQQLKKVPRIGFLAGGSRAADSLLLEAFWRRMNELGYIEGRTSRLSIALLRERRNGCRTLRRNWYG